MSYHSILTLLPSLLISLLLGALHITSAVILLKERHAGPRLMLAGSGIALIGQLVNQLSPFLLNGNDRFQIVRMLTVGAFASLGSLMFAIGLLLHALHLRGKANRIAELEAILYSRSNLPG